MNDRFDLPCPPQPHGVAELLNAAQLAQRLRVTVRTIRKWTKDGDLPYLKQGCRFFYNWDHVLAHMELRASLSPKRPPPAPSDGFLLAADGI